MTEQSSKLTSKEKLVLSLTLISLLSLLTPIIVPAILNINNGEQGFTLSASYYLEYITYIIGALVALFYLAVLSILLYVFKDR
ncbi:hypothetical protein JCM19046_176 [Bacillus sp. JCM 19046]|uniref:Uncharacterized protein n=1 Tax=Shouchella xiaoxiensis TaxID=766895 RepID=A0ABS2SY69_9BACI|nr:hypothetical protein [Shouchella xiaoxiensis]MBM7839187.1 hypothetical protein [Shouchella xiaoxiensis]GAF15134.1 hypothetical protein JCM19045_4479 [Bacillus sp. JCM 19045]GAF15777.1 hypothetical protein JCM19046_176 [Bacillus sp. JCM 19046]